MKTSHQSPVARRIVAALGIATLMTLPSTGIAQPKGAERLLKLNRPATPAALQSDRAGAPAPRLCPRCTDTWVKVTTPAFKGAHPRETHLVKQHACPGCGTERITTGHGKNRTTDILHVCTTCGSTGRNGGALEGSGEPTHGMTRH